jgi:hypothetical protein
MNIDTRRLIELAIIRADRDRRAAARLAAARDRATLAGAYPSAAQARRRAELIDAAAQSYHDSGARWAQ